MQAEFKSFESMSAKQRTYGILSLLMLGFDKFEVKSEVNKKGLNLSYEFSQFERRDNVLNESPFFVFKQNQSEVAFNLSLLSLLTLAYQNAIKQNKVDLNNDYNNAVAAILKEVATSTNPKLVEDIYNDLKKAQTNFKISKSQYDAQQANYIKIVNGENIFNLDAKVIKDFSTHMVSGAHYNKSLKRKVNQIS